MEGIRVLATKVSDHLTMSVQKLRIILQGVFEDLSVSPNDIDDLMDLNSISYRQGCEIHDWYERLHPVKVPWLPEDRSQLKDMTVPSCKSPWSIVLKYRQLNLAQLKDYEGGLNLYHFFRTPPVGAFVCVTLHKKPIRALVFDILSYSRFKVLDIDTNNVYIVPASSIYHMPPDVCEMHALSVHCCMIEDDDVVKKLWSEDLEAIFSRALKECSIRVEIVKTLCESPPKYLVELFGTNTQGHTRNLTEWLINVLIPDMKESIPRLLAKEELIYFLKNASIDPFVDDEYKYSESWCKQMKEQVLSGLRDVPPPIEGFSILSDNSSIALSVTSDEEYEEPSSTRQVGEPSSTRQIGEPSSTRQVGEPSSTRQVGEPSSTRQVGEPSSTRQVGEPSSTRQVGEPSSTRQVGEPSSTRQVGEPSSTRQNVRHFPRIEHK